MAYVTNLSKKNIDNILLNYNILNYVNYTPIYDHRLLLGFIKN